MERIRHFLFIVCLAFLVTAATVSAQDEPEATSDGSIQETNQCLDGDGTCPFDARPEERGKWNLFQSAPLLIYEITSFYVKLLDDYPLATKSVTSFLVGGFGDVLAQSLELHWYSFPGRLNLGRSLTIALEGLFVSGPLLHFAYGWMDEHLVLDQYVEDDIASKWIGCFLQVMFDLLVMDSIFVATLMVTSAVLQGRYKMIPQELRFDYLPAVRVSWLSSLSMAPLQFFNFGLVPLTFRVMITNLEDVIWNAAVSHMAHRSRR